jgi:hypothetical protein
MKIFARIVDGVMVERVDPCWRNWAAQFTCKWILNPSDPTGKHC